MREFPRHVHRPEGAYLIVASPAEYDTALAEGWWDNPNDIGSVPPEPEPDPVVDVPAEPPVLEKRKPGRPRKAAAQE